MRYELSHMENLYNKPSKDPVDVVRSDPELYKLWLQTNQGPIYEKVSMSRSPEDPKVRDPHDNFSPENNGYRGNLRRAKANQMLVYKGIMSTLELLKMRNPKRFDKLAGEYPLLTPFIYPEDY